VRWGRSPHEAFDRRRPLLFSIAYRMLGGVAKGRIRVTRLMLDPGYLGGAPCLKRFEKEVPG
jgi:hypothetical protein